MATAVGFVAVTGVLTDVAPASAANRSAAPGADYVAPGSVQCSVSAKISFSPALTDDGGGTNPSAISARLSSCDTTATVVKISRAKGTGSFSRSPISCVTKATTSASVTLSISWQGSASHRRTRFEPSTVSAGTTSGSFPGDAQMSLPLSGAVCSHRRVTRMTLTGTISLLDPYPSPPTSPSPPTGPTLPPGSPPRSSGPPSTPAPVEGLTGPVASLVSNSSGYCAVLASGPVECWGESVSGELGDGDATGPDICTGFGNPPDNVPCSTQAVSTGISATSLTAGYCAILADATVDCWSSSGYGQLGDGTTTGPDSCVLPDGDAVACSTTPVPVGISATSLAHSDSNYCAILTSGTVDCWGYNAFGQLGDGVSSGPDSCTGGLPCSDVPVSAGISATSIVGGGTGYCAILTDQSVDCWGGSAYGQLGDGTASGPDTCYLPATPKPIATPCSTTPVPTGISATSLASDGSGYCAILTDGTVDCWGDDVAGQLGAGAAGGQDSCSSFGDPCSTTPVSTGISATSLVSDGDGYCAILADQTVDCWGGNQYGQLGDGTASGPDSCSFATACSTTPAPVGISATSLATTGDGYCAILTDGTVDCWGGDQVGELGNGSDTGPQTCAFKIACSTTPLPVGISATNLAGDGAEDPGYCAVLTDGTVDCWGGDAVGELGNGTSINYAE